jgi:hypothetical protein
LTIPGVEMVKWCPVITMVTNKMEGVEHGGSPEVAMVIGWWCRASWCGVER